MACSVTGKLLSATTIDSSQIVNSVDLGLVDFVRYDVEIGAHWILGHSLIVLNNKEDFRWKQGIDLGLLEKDDVVYVATNFSRPLAIEMKPICNSRPDLEESIHLFLQPGLPNNAANFSQLNESARNNGTYSTLVHFKGLNVSGARISLDSKYVWKRNNEMLRLGPLGYDASLEFELSETDCNNDYNRYFNNNHLYSKSIRDRKSVV